MQPRLHPDSSASASQAPGVVAVVTALDGLELVPEAAFLAGALGRLGFRVHHLPVDFCTSEEDFKTVLASVAPAAVAFCYAKEVAELLLRAVALARAATAGPVLLFGDGLAREAAVPEVPPGVEVIAGEPGLGVGTRLGRAGPLPADHAETALALGPFGGAGLPLRPMAASLFAEPGTVGLIAVRGPRSLLAPTAFLARLEAPVGPAACRLVPEAALAPLRELGPELRMVEWWDRDVTVASREVFQEVARRGLAQSVRVMVDGDSAAKLPELRASGITRVVFEADRIEGLVPLPGSAASLEDIEPAAAAARALGLEVGVLAVVGLPGETRARSRERAAGLRRMAPDRLRVIPFEPSGGHPARDRLRAQGFVAERAEAWIRELHEPLADPEVPAEDFVANWADACLVLAEVEAARSGR